MRSVSPVDLVIDPYAAARVELEISAIRKGLGHDIDLAPVEQILDAYIDRSRKKARIEGRKKVDEGNWVQHVRAPQAFRDAVVLCIRTDLMSCSEAVALPRRRRIVNIPCEFEGLNLRVPDFHPDLWVLRARR